MQNEKVLADIEAEQAVLGALFFDATAHDGKAERLRELASVITADDFYRQTHRVIFKAMQALQSEKKPIDLVTMTEYLTKTGNFESVGGLPALTQLAQSASTAANIMHHAEIVKEYSQRRALAEKAAEISQLAFDESANIVESISRVQEGLATTLKASARAEMHPMNEVILAYSDILNARASGELEGIATGFPRYDEKIGRLQGGTLHIIAARPAMGKSALALCIAKNVCRQGYRVLYFSMEMPRFQLIDRLITNAARVPLQRLKNIKVDMQGVWNRVTQAMDAISKYNMEIDDRGHLTYSEIASKATAMQANGGLDLIIVDHLQIMGTDKSKRYANRANELDDITAQLKTLAMNLNVPIIALSQLSRANESRENKRPQLSDMRESGGIEQNADTVAGLYREGYYNDDNEDKRAELSVLKSRDGETGVEWLNWYGAYTLFTEGERPSKERKEQGSEDKQ